VELNHFEGFIKVQGGDIARDSIACIKVIEEFNQKVITGRKAAWDEKRKAAEAKRIAHVQMMDEYLKGQNAIDLKDVLAKYTKDTTHTRGMWWWKVDYVVQVTDYQAIEIDEWKIRSELIDKCSGYWHRLHTGWSKKLDQPKIIAKLTREYRDAELYNDRGYMGHHNMSFYAGLFHVQPLHQFTKLSGTSEFFMPISEYNLLLEALEHKAKIMGDIIKVNDSIKLFH
jgi:hypothetical protein